MSAVKEGERSRHSEKGKAREAKRPSFYKEDAFWRGMASVFNIPGYFTPRFYGRDPQQVDYEALRSDWEAISRDLERAIEHFETAHTEEIQKAQQQRLFDPDNS